MQGGGLTTGGTSYGLLVADLQQTLTVHGANGLAVTVPVPGMKQGKDVSEKATQPRGAETP